MASPTGTARPPPSVTMPMGMDDHYLPQRHHREHGEQRRPADHRRPDQGRHDCWRVPTPGITRPSGGDPHRLAGTSAYIYTDGRAGQVGDGRLLDHRLRARRRRRPDRRRLRHAGVRPPLSWSITATRPALRAVRPPVPPPTVTTPRATAPAGPRRTATTSYAYDQAERLTGSQRRRPPPATRTTATGCAPPRRVGSVTTAFTWDGSTKRRTCSPTAPPATSTGPAASRSSRSAPATQWYFHDQLGSTRALTDSTGAVVGTYAYTPYGTVSATPGRHHTSAVHRSVHRRRKRLRLPAGALLRPGHGAVPHRRPGRAIHLQPLRVHRWQPAQRHRCERAVEFGRGYLSTNTWPPSPTSASPPVSSLWALRSRRVCALSAPRFCSP